MQTYFEITILKKTSKTGSCRIVYAMTRILPADKGKIESRYKITNTRFFFSTAGLTKSIFFSLLSSFFSFSLRPLSFFLFLFAEAPLCFYLSLKFVTVIAAAVKLIHRCLIAHG